MSRRRYYSRNHWANIEKYNTVTAKLTDAFEILRSQGLIALKNHLCCQSCAGYDIATRVSKMTKAKRAKVKGCVYYHHQDESNFKRTGEVYLAYGPLESSVYGTVGLPDVEVGKMVVNALKQVGLDYEWDGSGDRRIIAKMMPPEPLDNGSGI
jgi:hypothetical protein